MSTAVRHDVMVAGSFRPSATGAATPKGGRVASGRHLHVVPSGSSVGEVGVARAALVARRRFAALCLAVIVLAGAVLAGRAMASAEPERGAVTVTVREGETLSQIAAREMPEWANGAAVVELQRVNGLDSLRVGAGQRLVVPAA